MSFTKRFIGDRAFYKRILAVALPIMIQQGITNFVSLLDNIMVGKLSTEAMSGVSIVNQFIFIYNLLIFGAVSAAGIFTAQFHGYGDTNGVRNTFRFKFIVNSAAGVLCVLLFALLDEPLINMFLHTSSAEGDLSMTLMYGKKYLTVMLIGLIPYSLSQVYGSTMRETGQTIVPMAASIIAVATNFVLNLILIFGLLGAPALGVVGAAIATVVSRFTELFILVIYAHTNKRVCPYLIGAFRSFKIPAALVKQISIKGLPLMLNEFLWSCAITVRNQCYSTRGLDAVAAQNICSTVFNVFSVVYMAVGSSIAIVVGNLLGAGRLEEARDTGRKMITFSIICSFLMSAVLILIAPLYPRIYNTTESVISLAQYMIIVSALTMPFAAFANASYFTLRSGGQVFVTFLFDSGYMWSIVAPISLIVAYFTDISILGLFPICQGLDAFKSILAVYFLKKGTWVKQIVIDDDLRKSA